MCLYNPFLYLPNVLMHLFHVRTNLKGVERPLQPACWIQFAQLPTAILNSRVLPYCVRVDWVHGGWPSVGYGVLLYKTETNLVLLSLIPLIHIVNM